MSRLLDLALLMAVNSLCRLLWAGEYTDRSMFFESVGFLQQRRTGARTQGYSGCWQTRRYVNIRTPLRMHNL